MIVTLQWKIKCHLGLVSYVNKRAALISFQPVIMYLSFLSEATMEVSKQSNKSAVRGFSKDNINDIVIWKFDFMPL